MLEAETEHVIKVSPKSSNSECWGSKSRISITVVESDTSVSLSRTELSYPFQDQEIILVANGPSLNWDGIKIKAEWHPGCGKDQNHDNDKKRESNTLELTAYSIEIRVEEKPEDGDWSALGTGNRGTYAVTGDPKRRWFHIWEDYENRIGTDVKPQCLSDVVEDRSFTVIETDDFEDAGMEDWKEITSDEGEYKTVIATIHFKNGGPLEGTQTPADVLIRLLEVELTAPEKTINLEDDPLLPPKNVAPVMLNDEFQRDAGGDIQTYTAGWSCRDNCPDGASCSLGHRELEPVLAMNYIGESPNEKNLLHIELRYRVSKKRGPVSLWITLEVDTPDRVRIWPAKTKGTKLDIIDLQVPEIYSSDNMIPNQWYTRSFYIEGLDIGEAKFTAKVREMSVLSPRTKTTEFSVHVVSLVESQDGKRKVINEKGKHITFEIMGGAAFKGKVRWREENTALTHWRTMDGNNYMSAIEYCDMTFPDSPHKVKIPEDAANRRFVSTVTADICETDIRPGQYPPSSVLSLLRKVRVAQNTYQGGNTTTPAGDDEIAFRRAQVQGLAVPPPGFNNTETDWWGNDDGRDYSESYYNVLYTGEGAPTINSRRLQYAPAWEQHLLVHYPEYDWDNLGLTMWNEERGAKCKVYALFIFSRAYNIETDLGETTRLAREDLVSIAQHECQHARQLIAIRDGGNHWRTMDAAFSSGIITGVQFAAFLEADAYLTDLTSDAGSWKYIAFVPFSNFTDYKGYGKDTHGALECCNGKLPAPTKAAAKAILQAIYKEIGKDSNEFIEMKRHHKIGDVPGYTPSIRAPK